MPAKIEFFPLYNNPLFPRINLPRKTSICHLWGQYILPLIRRPNLQIIKGILLYFQEVFRMHYLCQYRVLNSYVTRISASFASNWMAITHLEIQFNWNHNEFIRPFAMLVHVGFYAQHLHHLTPSIHPTVSFWFCFPFKWPILWQSVSSCSNIRQGDYLHITMKEVIQPIKTMFAPSKSIPISPYFPVFWFYLICPSTLFCHL